jgi:hypothetical protein
VVLWTEAALYGRIEDYISRYYDGHERALSVDDLCAEPALEDGGRPAIALRGLERILLGASRTSTYFHQPPTWRASTCWTRNGARFQ